jgi:hypothetical protein
MTDVISIICATRVYRLTHFLRKVGTSIQYSLALYAYTAIFMIFSRKQKITNIEFVKGPHLITEHVRDQITADVYSHHVSIDLGGC